MTIKKSQEQTLTHIGLVLMEVVFTHGELYVALSQVTKTLMCISLSQIPIRLQLPANWKIMVYLGVFG